MIRDGDNRVPLGPALTCRQARNLIRAQRGVTSREGNGEYGDSRLTAHLMRCPRCEAEARVDRLYRTILRGDLESSGVSAAPDTIWLKGLRARIEREGSPKAAVAEDSFAGIVSLVARQMVPVMAALILLIVGATLFWNRAPAVSAGTNDPVLMNQVVEYPQPTADDVLGTLLAVEDKKNGK